MGHDTHFLSRLARVSDADVELAMSLYRDVSLVRAVVEAAQVPDDATRMAIALDASDAPPLVLVERSGRFVTCLAPGMKTDLPIISRAALDRQLRVKEENERAKEVADRYDAVWRKPTSLYEKCEQADLETMEVLLMTAPLSLGDTVEITGTCSHRMYPNLLTLLRRERVRPRETPLLEEVWRQNWTLSHNLLIASVGMRAQTDNPALISWLSAVAVMVGVTQFLPWTLRAVWACAHVGKPMLPVLKETMADPAQFDRTVPALALTTMALGHRKLEGEIRKVLERYKDRKDCAELLPVLDEPENHVEEAVLLAGEMGVHLTEHLSEEHPARIHTEDAVPAEYALALLARTPMSRIHAMIRPILLGALPLLARARAEDFYVPHAVVKHWKGLDGVEEMTRIVETELGSPGRVEARAPDNPGRNDPCRCGSGRKYKKCCA